MSEDTKEMGGYPYTTGERGIPFVEIVRAFKTGGTTEGTITSGSGAELNYDIGNDHIYIKDPKSRDYYLQASVLDSIASFNIRTRNLKAGVHPDMFAKEFVGFALRYFRDNGIRVDACKGTWTPGTANYDAYQRALNRHKSRVEAAKETWSGRVFISNGFSEIADGDISHIEAGKNVTVSAIFRKPNEV